MQLLPDELPYFITDGEDNDKEMRKLPKTKMFLWYRYQTPVAFSHTYSTVGLYTVGYIKEN